MLSFRHFLSEETGDVTIPVVSITESLSFDVDSINDQLDGCLTESLANPYIGWLNSARILEQYGIKLPKVLFKDILEGEEVVALNMNESEEEHYFYYVYNFVKEGYHSFASIVNQSELEELLAEE
jgi:hypothetical protein